MRIIRWLRAMLTGRRKDDIATDSSPTITAPVTNTTQMQPRRLSPYKGRKGPSMGRKYKGVYPQTKTPYKYRVEINTIKGRTYAGTFDTEEEAARAYDTAAYQLWGPTAYQNFPKVNSQ